VSWPKTSRSLACIVILFAVAFLAHGCGHGKGSAGTTAVHVDHEGTTGNTPGNVASGGAIVQGDGFVYYATGGHAGTNPRNTKNGKLCRVSVDGGDGRVLKDDPDVLGYDELNYADGWLYFIMTRPVYSSETHPGVGAETMGIYKMRSDGTELTLVYDDPSIAGPSYLSYADGWLYFATGTEKDGCGASKVRPDGTGLTELAAGLPSTAYGLGIDMVVYGGWVYYSDYQSIYRVRTDGSGRTKLFEQTTSGKPTVGAIEVQGEWIYFRSTNGEESRFFRMRTDGTGRTEFPLGLSSQELLPLFRFNVTEDWVYFSYEPEAGAWSIAKVRTDGTSASPTEVLGGKGVEGFGWLVSPIFVLGDYVYYATSANNDFGLSWYRVKSDGSQSQLLD